MPKPAAYAASAVLLLHGIVHFIATGVYLEVLDLPAFQYTTTLLAGHLAVGDVGIRVFGALWGVAAAGFAVSAGAMLREWEHWPVLLGGMCVLSLGLTGLSVTVAYGGFAMNLAILAALVLRQRVSPTTPLFSGFRGG